MASLAWTLSPMETALPKLAAPSTLLTSFFFFPSLVVLGFEPRDFCMLGKCSATGLYAKSLDFFFGVGGGGGIAM